MSKFYELCKEFNKKHKAEIITDGLKPLEVPRIQFSSPFLNYQTHGGFPRGKVVEFFGTEGSGKTSTALDVVASAQELFKIEYEAQLKELEGDTTKKGQEKYKELKERGPLKCVYFDLEHTLDYEWAYVLGVNLNDNFWLVDPEAQSAEEILDLLVEFVKSGEVGLIVLDSIPYLEPEAQLDESLEKKEYGGISKILTSFFRKVTPHLNSTTASLLVINQMRDSMNPYKLYETPGGRGLKHACSLRIQFNKGELLDKNLEPTKRSSEVAYGNVVNCKIEKTKICKPDRLIGNYTLTYYNGIDWVKDLVEMLVSLGIIIQSGSWFTMVDPNTGEELPEYKTQGKTNVVKLLKDNDELLSMYLDYANENIIK